MWVLKNHSIIKYSVFNLRAYQIQETLPGIFDETDQLKLTVNHTVKNYSW